MKYLLFGHGSYKNKGCEALVTTICNQIKQLNSNNYIIVASFDKANDERNKNIKVDKYVHHSIENNLNEKEKKLVEKLKNQNETFELNKIYQREVLNAVDEVDICLSIGGDNYSEGFVPYLNVISSYAKKHGKKLVLVGSSLYENIYDINLIHDLRQYDLVITRESLTTNALKNIVEKERLIQIPDPAFSLLPVEVNFAWNEKQYICINVSDIIIKNNDHSFADLCSLIDYILKNTKYDILLLPHVYVSVWNDLETLRKFKEFYKSNERVILLDKKEYSCGEYKYIIRNAYMLIAARTHASIAGYSSMVPTLVLGYSVKSKGIAYDIFGNYDNYVIPYQTLNAEILIEKFEYIRANYKKIKKTLENKMPYYINGASTLIETMTKKLSELNTHITFNHMCVGCKVCSLICPQKAITMKKDNEGFLYPSINKSKCINCGKCKKHCPNNQEKYNYLASAYACQNKNEKILLNSSSGGVFNELARYTLNHKGIVYGATFDNLKVYHKGINNIADIELLMGSKYVQSDLKNTFNEVKNNLNDNKLVLYSGTPCQISALKSFLNNDFDNLITISVICHGVPGPNTFEDHIKKIELENSSRMKSFVFRAKETGWPNYSLKYIFDNKNIVIDPMKDMYFYGFLNNYFLRKSCYYCNFKMGSLQNADIIIGDFWNVDKFHDDFDLSKGVSAVIINSRRGKLIFNDIKDKFLIVPSLVKNIEKVNPLLNRSVEMPVERLLFNPNFETCDSFVKNILLGNQNEELDNNKTLKKIIEEKNTIITQQSNELDAIYKSKRWKYINKLANAKNRLFRKEK